MSPGRDTGDDTGYDPFLPERWAQGTGDRVAGTGGANPVDDTAARRPVGEESVLNTEVRDIYLPLARWIEDRVPGRGPVGTGRPTTTVIGITGSVASGKSTLARVLVGLLRSGPGRPSVDLLATDGFLLPNRVLGPLGLLGRKGFPETYDHGSLAAALGAVRSGQAEVAVPVYSHATYDIVPDEVHRIRRPDLLVVEGLTVLQDLPTAVGEDGQESVTPTIASMLDLSVYLDADEEALGDWHVERLLDLRNDTGTESDGFLGWFASLPDAEAERVAAASWTEINLVNLRDHVAPTRSRADVILEKGRDHRVRRVLVRRRSVPGAAGPVEG